MALIYCPECGTQVSDQAQACIKCSYPIYKLRSNINNQNNFTQTNYPQSIAKNKQTDETNNGLIIAGYVVAFLSLLILPVILSIAGIVIGGITISKGQTGHGVAHILLSIFFGILGFIMGTLTYFFN